jgi:biopolymer transport protein ExbD
MAKLNREDVAMDMTPMIDMVFQLMIFFLVTIKMDQDQINETIKLARAPHGPIIEERDPRTIIIEVDKSGRISLGGTYMRPELLKAILQSSVYKTGFGIPILIRGHLTAPHQDIRRVMDICCSVGLWRIQFAAIQKDAKGGKK